MVKETDEIKNLIDFISEKYFVRRVCNNDKSIQLEIYGIGNIYSVPVGCLMLYYDKAQNRLEIIDSFLNDDEVSTNLINDVMSILGVDVTSSYMGRNRKIKSFQFNFLSKKTNQIYKDEDAMVDVLTKPYYKSISSAKSKNEGHK